MEGSLEQRKSPRIKTHIPIKIRKLKGPSTWEGESSVTKNLSSGGIRFRTAEFISMACRLVLELDIPMFTKPVKAISKVAWIRKMPSGDDYEVGNQFLEMSKEDKELVSEYVSSLNLYNGSDLSEEGSAVESEQDTQASS